MTVSDILTKVRDELDDTEPDDYLWEDDVLIGHVDDTVNEVATEIPLIVTTYTKTGITTLNTLEYAIDDYIVKITRAKLGTDNFLDIRSFEYLDESYPTWESDSSGEPHTLVDDFKTGYIHVYPKPDADNDDVLTLRVWRRPVTPLTLDTQTPEIPAHLHRYLIEGVIYRAYNKHDSQTYNPKKATEFLAMWRDNIEKIKRQYLKTKYRESVAPILRGNL